MFNQLNNEENNLWEEFCKMWNLFKGEMGEEILAGAFVASKALL